MVVIMVHTLKTVLDRMRDFYQVMPQDTYIASVGTTGYGEHIVKAAIHADLVKLKPLLI